MNKGWKKTVAILMVLVMSIGFGIASAEETVSVILNAGTTQAFTSDEVPEDDLKTILEAGLSATSAINQQPWYFAAVTNREVMEEISGGSGFGGAPMGMPEGGFPEGFDQMPEGMNGLPEGAGFETPEGIPEGAAPQGDFPGGNMPQGMPAASGSAKAAMGDSPVAIIVYMNENTSSPNASFDCGLACQNMVIAANALGYGTKIISSPTMALNGDNHDAMCEKLGVDPAYTAVAVLLIGTPDQTVDGATGASERSAVEDKVSFVK